MTPTQYNLTISIKTFYCNFRSNGKTATVYLLSKKKILAHKYVSREWKQCDQRTFSSEVVEERSVLEIVGIAETKVDLS